MEQYDIIIVGAGPTGLMAAVQLARFNINFLIIDSKAGPTEQSRAIVMTARSMELYQQLNISDTAIEQGKFITDFYIYVKGKEKAHAHIGEFGKGKTDFSYMLAFEQSKNEKLLVDKLNAYQYNVSWQTELVTLTRQNDFFEAEVKYLDKPGAPQQKLRAKYIIGCDGARSVVRHSFDFSFKGGTYESQFYVADTVLKWDKNPNALILCPSRKNFCGFFPMGGSNSHRIIGTMPKEFNNRDDITFADVESSIKEAVTFPVAIEKMNWFSIYKLHHRSVQKFNDSNCFLAGDAAHIHSPAGGQGMNTGLQDAYNLTWKLALVIKDIADKKILDSYNEERLPFAKWLLKFTDRAFSIMTSKNIFIVWLRNTIIPLFVKLFLGNPSVRSVLFNSVSQLQWSYKNSSLSQNSSSQKLKFTSGDRLPYILLGQTKESIYKLLTAPAFHLLMIGEAKPVLKPNQIINVITLGMEEWKEQGVTKPLYILVRPDNYIGLIADEMSDSVLDTYLQQYCFFK
jgi:2-polyprenyl-6-methoxyphenol hydroxylase-like FAD-dependent oxidoreductase